VPLGPAQPGDALDVEHLHPARPTQINVRQAAGQPAPALAKR
jgi:hypothetical protein